MSLAAGTWLGRYEILGLIGAGGMGEVYKGRDTRLDRTVAIKVLPPHVATDPHRRARFEREARTVAALNHPHICQLFDVGHDDGADFLVLEYLDGQTLKQRLQSGALPLAQAVRCAIEVADALAKAHRLGILHRDLKPGNIMLTIAGTKLLDFGLAKLKPTDTSQVDDVTTSASLTQHGAIFGTLQYMAPEQLEAKEADTRSDLFAFGAVFYEMLTGRKAFRTSTQAGLIAEILRGDPPGLEQPELAPFANLLKRCLAKDRDERWESAADLKQVLEWTAGSSASGAKQAAPSTTWVRAVGFTLLAVLAAAVVAVWFASRSDFFWRNPLADAHFTRLTDFEGTETDADISADGQFVAFVSDRDGTFDAWVHQIGTGEFANVTKGRVSELLLDSVRNVKFSGDGGQVWLRMGTQKNLRAIQLGLWQVPTMGGVPRPLSDVASGAATSPDGSSVAYHGFTDGDPIYIADRNFSHARRIYIDKPGVHCHFLAWSPDGRYVYFSKGIPPVGEWDIWRVPAAGGAIERMTNQRARVFYPTPIDNRTLVYTAAAEEGSRLYAIDVERRIPHRVSSGVEQYVSVAAGGPQRQRLVATVTNPSGTLWTVPVSRAVAQESAAARVAVPTVRAISPRFGRDYIAYVASRGGADGLWKWSQGAAVELWNGSQGAVAFAPAISPDGGRICYAIRKGARTVLQLMTSNGTDVRALAESLDVRSAASWSPDGKWVTVAADEGSGPRIFKVPVEGGTAVRLTEENSSNPVWSPGGGFIVYMGPDVNATFPLRGVTPEKQNHAVPELWLQRDGGEHIAFLPGSDAIVIQQGEFWNRRPDFWEVDLKTGRQRQLTKLRPGYTVRNFDVSADGREILFDRIRENSDIVLIELGR
jgi:Tol biopolymer transport system component/predicted Ser/Thr protein kinase